MAYSKVETQELMMDSRSTDDMNKYCRRDAYNNPVCWPCRSGIWFKYDHNRRETWDHSLVCAVNTKHPEAAGQLSAAVAALWLAFAADRTQDLFITELCLLIICVFILSLLLSPGSDRQHLVLNEMPRGTSDHYQVSSTVRGHSVGMCDHHV